LNGQASGIFTNPATVQDLRYTYDPVGNITQITDAALATVIYAGQTVEPVCRYTYDAVYRLIEATGREHIDQSAFQFAPANCNYRDYPFVGPAQTNDPRAVRNYTERYEYDPVGNFERMMHRAASGGWTRAYEYQEPSLIEDGVRVTPRKTSNRLSRTTVHPDGNQPIHEPYTYDAHGNMATMSHLPLMQWDFKDELSATSKQVTNDCAPETTFYIYDAAGQRVRKVTERQNGTRKDERIYLGGFEIFRVYSGSGTTVTLARETLHIMDDQQRIALVETRTQGNEPGVPQQLIRYQFNNHLSSASLELDRQARIISYEEYYPYGSTSYQSARSQTETPKRYRYTGKERDEESGLYYHGARYYAPWLGRWASCDPAELVDGTNGYLYVRGNALKHSDPTGLATKQVRLNYHQGISEAAKYFRELRQKGFEIAQEVYLSAQLRADALKSKGGRVLELVEHKRTNLRAPTYRLGKGALKESAFLARVGKYYEQAYKYSIEAIESGLVNARTGKPLGTRLVFSLKGSKEQVLQARKLIEQTAIEYESIFADLAKRFGSKDVPKVTAEVRNITRSSTGSATPGFKLKLLGVAISAIDIVKGGLQITSGLSHDSREEVQEGVSNVGIGGLGVIASLVPATAAAPVAVAALPLILYETFLGKNGLVEFNRVIRDPNLLRVGPERQPLEETPLPSPSEIEYLRQALGGE
jgi:RHS repeat-associated protein